MSATLLQMVNRVRRRMKWEDVSSFSSSDELTTAIIDYVNEAKRDVLESWEWDFDIRTDGVLKTTAKQTYTDKVTLTNGSTTVSVNDTDYGDYDGGDLRLRARFTEDTTYGNTNFIVSTATTVAGVDTYTLETAWPGTSAAAFAGSAEFMVSEYVLPTTVRDVLSVMVEESDVTVQFVDKATTLDRAIPNPFDEESDQPEVCIVGGSTTPTVASGDTATPGLGLWLYPVPSSVYVVRYTYRYRHPSLSATTDTLQVPDHVIDEIVSLAQAYVHESRTQPDPEMAQQLRISTDARIRRKAKRTSPQPLERISLQSHDRRSSGLPRGSRPSNPRVFYTP